MKGLKYVVLLPLLLLMGCKSEVSDRTDMNLRGDVKSLWERKYVAEDVYGVAQKGKLISSVKCLFNKDGQMTATYWFNSDGDTIQRVIQIYDEKGQLTQKKMYGDFGELDFVSKFTYDEKNRVVEILDLDPDDFMIKRTVKGYNDDNLIETTLEYDKKENLTSKTIVQKNKEDLPKEVKIYNAERELVNFRREVYNEKKNLTEFTVFAPDETTVMLHAKLSYDRGGNLTSIETVGENNEAFEKEENVYQFDQKNNWIYQGHYVGGEIKELVNREIEYY